MWLTIGLGIVAAHLEVLVRSWLPDMPNRIHVQQDQNEFTLNLANGSVLSQDALANGIGQGKIVCLKKGCVGEHDVNGKESHNRCQVDNLNKKLEHEAVENISDRLAHVSSQLQDSENLEALSACSTGSAEERKFRMDIELLAHQKLLLDGFLWNGFMARSSNLSKDVQWVDYLCPQCSCLIGAYPSLFNDTMLDGGIRLLKCYISTCFPVLDSNDFFRCYSLERMFSIQLLESAKEELSFRTVVRDMRTNDPLLQLILLNPDSWC